MSRKYRLLPTLAAALLLTGCLQTLPEDTTNPSDPSATGITETLPTETTTVTVPTTQPPTEPVTEPPVVKETTASVGAIGDILMHNKVYKSGYDSATGTYNYDSIFAYLQYYAESVDYAIANMEGTLCGNDNGYDYIGEWVFNSPDALAEALQKAGFDMLLTANNHSFDTRNVGLLRTQQVISGLGMDYTGTVMEPEDDNFLVRDINGIRVGMICYTYYMGLYDENTLNFNTISVSAEDAQRINVFRYDDLDSFYAKLSGQLAQMQEAGAEATVLFIHWGDEYALTPNSTQASMAQALCDMGIDVIIGGHPHVIQPMELLESTVDPSHKTVCLYSTGNAVSNQRLGKISAISTAHTEDGVLFTVNFAKYSDGTVLVESVDVLPLWVNMNSNSGSKKYPIVPLDPAVEDWKGAFAMTSGQLTKAQDSYGRTMALLQDGLTAVNRWCAENQAAVEAALGVN